MTMSAHRDRLRTALAAGVSALGQTLDDPALDRLLALAAELARWSARYNLTAIREPERMIPAHLLDSLSIRGLLAGSRVLDVGTGAGFPGLPLAIAEPGRQFVLLDASRKKLRFVRHAIGELGLANAAVEHRRVEDYAPGEGFDTVTSRALGSLAHFAAAGAPLLRPGGRLVAMKGRDPGAEAGRLGGDWRVEVIPLSVPGLGAERHAVLLAREAGRPA